MPVASVDEVPYVVTVGKWLRPCRLELTASSSGKEVERVIVGALNLRHLRRFLTLPASTILLAELAHVVVLHRLPQSPGRKVLILPLGSLVRQNEAFEGFLTLLYLCLCLCR